MTAANRSSHTELDWMAENLESEAWTMSRNGHGSLAADAWLLAAEYRFAAGQRSVAAANLLGAAKMLRGRRSVSLTLRAVDALRADGQSPAASRVLRRALKANAEGTPEGRGALWARLATLFLLDGQTDEAEAAADEARSVLGGSQAYARLGLLGRTAWLEASDVLGVGRRRCA